MLSATISYSQEVKLVSFNELSQIINRPDGKTKVINLWATWCKPCVEELPVFMKAVAEYGTQNTEFIFVSVDFLSQNQKVIDKVNELQMKGILVHLNESGSDWIDKMDPDWSGAIPYTILIRPDSGRSYHYDSFANYDELKNFLDKNISH